MLIDNIKGTQCAPIVVQALSHFVHTQEMQDSDTLAQYSSYIIIAKLDSMV